MFRLLVRLTSLIALDALSQPGSNCDWTWFNGHWQAEDKAKSETDYGSLSILIPFPRHLMIILEQYDTKNQILAHLFNPTRRNLQIKEVVSCVWPFKW